MINLAYLAAAVLFILGLKGLSHPKTAVRGNLLGATGMLVAVIATFFYRDPTLTQTPLDAFVVIAAAVAVGTVIGMVLAVRIQMTAMPQMVALLNGFGGGASVLVAGAALVDGHTQATLVMMIATGASGRNWASYGGSVDIAADAPEWQRRLITDPQTSGGLLIACDPAAVAEVQAVLRAEQGEEGSIIGRLRTGAPRLAVS